MARAETRGTQGGTVCRIVGAIVCTGVCSVAEVTAAENLGMRALAGPPALTASARQAIARPVIRGAADARRAWLGAEHKGLTVQKVSNRIDRSLAIELRFRRDTTTISIDSAANVTVARGNQSVQLASADSYERLQQVLAGSEAVLAARLLLAERESESDLQPAEMSLLSTAAFVASLVGDVDAPRRLATRFVEKHRGIYRSVRLRNCFETYSTESSNAWNDMQSCMEEANQDSSLFNRAYRRVACNGVWLMRAETAWVEYIGCMGLGALYQ
jgi:hypothetical protein